MNARTLIASLAFAVSLAAGSAQHVIAQDPGVDKLNVEFPVQGLVTWTDYEGEAAYRVSGTVAYLPPPDCSPGRGAISSEGMAFSEELPANQTSFSLPSPSDRRLTWRKDLEVTVEALDADGNVVARNGYAMVADQFCTPEEMAAAGTGGGQSSGTPAAVAVAALLAAGTVLFGGGLALAGRRT